MTPEKFSSPLFLIFVLIMAFLLGTYLLRPSRFEERKKVVALVSLGIGGLGLFGLLAQNRIFFADAQTNILNFSSEGDKVMLQSFVRGQWACLPSNRTEFSPDNFDEIVVAKKALCEWQRNSFETLEEMSLYGFPELPDSFSNGIPEISKPFYANYSSEFDRAIYKYENSRNLLAKTRANAEKNVFEILLELYSPFLIAVAIGFSASSIVREPNAH